MRKTAVAVLAAALLLLIPGCEKSGAKELTLETVCALADKKGDRLTWSDFERYASTQTGSGLYILKYELDGGYELWIGGVPDEAPMYIKLLSAEDRERSIDIRYENIAEFLDAER